MAGARRALHLGYCVWTSPSALFQDGGTVGAALDLINHTPFPALLTRFGASIDTMASSLVARVTYDIRDGRLLPSVEQSWTVSPKPWECQYEPMESDEAFYKGGTDVFVFGSFPASSPRSGRTGARAS